MIYVPLKIFVLFDFFFWLFRFQFHFFHSGFESIDALQPQQQQHTRFLYTLHKRKKRDKFYLWPFYFKGQTRRYLPRDNMRMRVKKLIFFLPTEMKGACAKSIVYMNFRRPNLKNVESKQWVSGREREKEGGTGRGREKRCEFP